MFGSNSKTSNLQSLKDEKKIDENSDVQVFVWSGGMFNGLGHVALQLDDEKPKRHANDPGNYVSIWPKATPAGGLTSVMPLEATFCKTLDDDCMQEARRPPVDFSDLLESIEPLPIEPTIYTIKNLDKEKMKNELHRIEENLGTGNVSYQLLPGVNLTGFIHRFWPVNVNKPEVYNCVTLTQHLLKQGGMTNAPKSPWTTPAKLERFFKNEIKTKSNTREQKEKAQISLKQNR